LVDKQKRQRRARKAETANEWKTPRSIESAATSDPITARKCYGHNTAPIGFVELVPTLAEPNPRSRYPGKPPQHWSHSLATGRTPMNTSGGQRSECHRGNGVQDPALKLPRYINPYHPRVLRAFVLTSARAERLDPPAGLDQPPSSDRVADAKQG